MSNFWRRVDEELEYKGLNRSYLAKECGFSLTNIGQGIKLGSTPSAETAVKIAKVLDVSVEYLVTGEVKAETESNPKLNIINQASEIRARKLLNLFTNLSERDQELLISFAKTMEENNN